MKIQWEVLLVVGFILMLSVSSGESSEAEEKLRDCHNDCKENFNLFSLKSIYLPKFRLLKLENFNVHQKMNEQNVIKQHFKTP